LIFKTLIQTPGANTRNYGLLQSTNTQKALFRLPSFAEGVNELHIKSPDHEGHIHHKAGSVGSGHAHDAKAYLTAISNALRNNQEILIVGDGGAKTELAHFIRDHVPLLAPRIMRWS
jgi:hypothetical protein